MISWHFGEAGRALLVTGMEMQLASNPSVGVDFSSPMLADLGLLVLNSIAASVARVVVYQGKKCHQSEERLHAMP